MRPSTAPSVPDSDAYATNDIVRTAAPTIPRSAADAHPRAAPHRIRLHELEVREARKAEAPASVRPTTSCSARSPMSHGQPATTATSASVPMTTWLKRGARESMTSRSRYGSAELLGRRFTLGSITGWLGSRPVGERVECRAAGPDVRTYSTCGGARRAPRGGARPRPRARRAAERASPAGSSRVRAETR